MKFIVMKKILLLSMLLVSICSFAQNNKTVYCEMIGSGSFSGKSIKISFDFGSESFSYKADDDYQLVDEKGNAIRFSSMINALNYMSERGWKLHTAYSASVKGMGAQETYRYILVKELQEGEATLDGITLLGKFKEQKEEKEKRKSTWDDVYK